MLSPVEMDIIVKLLIAAVIGCIVGLEREIRHKPAGLRTHALVCIGAALFTVMSAQIGGAADPARISAGIVTGIGFLGAGIIFKYENKVTGLTTAAELWTIAAVGIAIGAGMYTIAVATAALVMLLLVPGKILEKTIHKGHKKDRFSD